MTTGHVFMVRICVSYSLMINYMVWSDVEESGESNAMEPWSVTVCRHQCVLVRLGDSRRPADEFMPRAAGETLACWSACTAAQPSPPQPRGTAARAGSAHVPSDSVHFSVLSLIAALFNTIFVL